MGAFWRVWAARVSGQLRTEEDRFGCHLACWKWPGCPGRDSPRPGEQLLVVLDAADAKAAPLAQVPETCGGMRLTSGGTVSKFLNS